MGANRCVVKTITNPAAQLLETTHVHVQEQHHQYHPLEITQPHCRYQAYLKKHITGNVWCLTYDIALYPVVTRLIFYATALQISKWCAISVPMLRGNMPIIFSECSSTYPKFILSGRGDVLIPHTLVSSWRLFPTKRLLMCSRIDFFSACIQLLICIS